MQFSYIKIELQEIYSFFFHIAFVYKGI